MARRKSTYRYGFKTEAADLAREVRAELGLGAFDRLDPRTLAAHLDIPILDLSALMTDAPNVAHLRDVEPGVFSAVTVFYGTHRTIVHNDVSGRAN